MDETNKTVTFKYRGEDVEVPLLTNKEITEILHTNEVDAVRTLEFIRKQGDFVENLQILVGKMNCKVDRLFRSLEDCANERTVYKQAPTALDLESDGMAYTPEAPVKGVQPGDDDRGDFSRKYPDTFDSDVHLLTVVKGVVAKSVANFEPKVFSYGSLVGKLIGRVMQEVGGKANTRIVKDLVSMYISFYYVAGVRGDYSRKYPDNFASGHYKNRFDKYRKLVLRETGGKHGIFK